jgi:hypothetical protein
MLFLLLIVCMLKFIIFDPTLIFPLKIFISLTDQSFVQSSEILLSFASDREISLSTHVHFIQVFRKAMPYLRTIFFKKIPPIKTYLQFLDSILFILSLFRSDIERIIVLYFNKYLLQTSRSNQRLFIDELFNASFVQMHLLHHMKSDHIPCEERKNLVCFYDESHMCIHNRDIRQTNCFTFSYSMNYNCQITIV